VDSLCLLVKLSSNIAFQARTVCVDPISQANLEHFKKKTSLVKVLFVKLDPVLDIDDIAFFSPPQKSM
jgi:hypothetical protein